MSLTRLLRWLGWGRLSDQPILNWQERMLLARLPCPDGRVPGGHGEFGLTATNPVPTHRIAGSKLYLSKLRDADNYPLKYQRRGSTTNEVCPYPIDVYKILDPRRSVLTIYLSPYYRKNSRHAPRGFRLVR